MGLDTFLDVDRFAIDGFGIYEYDKFGRRERGVLAQEVEKIMPEAVLEHPSGYKMVNYGAL